MAVNLPDYTGIATIDLNVSRIGVGSEVPENIKNYIRDNIIGWLDITSFGLFISLLIYFINIKEYDVYKSLLFSSIGSFMVSYSFLASGFSKNITSLIIYGTLILVSTIAVYLNKKKGI